MCRTSFGHKEGLMDMDKNELIARIKTVIDMESRSASMAPITPPYVSRMLNVPVEVVEEAMKEMGIS